MRASALLPENRIDRVIALLAIAAAVAYLLLQRPYPGDVAVKTSMCVLLAVLALRGGKKLFALALAFSAAGDAFLAIDGERLFVPGLASFLLTHLLYAAIFLRSTRPTSASLLAGMSRERKIALVSIPLFAIAYTMFLWPHLGTLAIPVVIYIAAIVAMAMMSLRVAALSVPVGAVSFMTSDSLIALEKFVWQADWLGPLVWVTYALAQLLITHGLLVRAGRESQSK